MYTVWVSSKYRYTVFYVEAPSEAIARVRAEVRARLMWKVSSVSIVAITEHAA